MEPLTTLENVPRKQTFQSAQNPIEIIKENNSEHSDDEKQDSDYEPEDKIEEKQEVAENQKLEEVGNPVENV